jgi:hypothetical protein
MDWRLCPGRVKQQNLNMYKMFLQLWIGTRLAAIFLLLQYMNVYHETALDCFRYRSY